MPTSSRPRTVVRSLAGISTAAVVLAGCGLTEGKPGVEGAIAVTATDNECQVARTEAPAGQIEFTVRNTGTKVNEFYVYAEGDRVMGEVENIGPGLERRFLVRLDEPGTYETACKPGLVGQGIRAPFTVTGEAVDKTDDERLVEAPTRTSVT